MCVHKLSVLFSRAPRAGRTLFHDPHKARPLTLLTARAHVWVAGPSEVRSMEAHVHLLYLIAPAARRTRVRDGPKFVLSDGIVFVPERDEGFQISRLAGRKLMGQMYAYGDGAYVNTRLCARVRALSGSHRCAVVTCEDIVQQQHVPTCSVIVLMVESGLGPATRLTAAGTLILILTPRENNVNSTC
ncbi:hypothetical protein X777_10581 [Ooceraea biroi]|uniref:Uncharacterized protein n=1 Tax=Ooceraea biroi TaxID=2015173 RepID=A0A026W4K2_OOCBI|nr:hypothetical protein X777_10581 [Ooceraea biroi]